MTTPSIEEVARKLTKAQRDLVLLLGPSEERRPVRFYADVVNRLCVATTQRGPLVTKRRLANRGMVYAATPLGIAVRAHLTAGATHDR